MKRQYETDSASLSLFCTQQKNWVATRTKKTQEMVKNY